MTYIVINTDQKGKDSGRVEQAVKAKLLEAYGFDYVKKVCTGWMHAFGKQYTVIFIKLGTLVHDGLICTDIVKELGLTGIWLFDDEGELPLRLMLLSSRERANYEVFTYFTEDEQEYMDTDWESTEDYILVHVNNRTVWYYINSYVAALEK